MIDALRPAGLARSARATGLVLCFAFLLPRAGAAQREPVLPQVRVPHTYYWREMYLPQLTSGPSGATWSPDGRELVYSMQGSLWRQAVGSGEARQLTDGPGYDYQPDWSPDGRYIVFASYTGAAIDLRLLDLSTGAVATLVVNGAVNVEPRWSPDGSRIAFVSTAFNGRFHVFTVAVRNGQGAEPVRLTEERDSGLPRYYYSGFDQYLSPTWSPDGRELILVSNRDHVWGSGTLWRMAAEPGAAMRQIRDEETTWRARPDWARDGRRVVYSSYFGRQRNQLWLMTGDGENPFQLTYGEFDATDPRWSPDGRHIAYISNQTGNTSLWVVQVPGGRRTRVPAERRVPLHPSGRLELVALDRRSGREVPARVAVVGADGRSFAPEEAWRHADDGFDRGERRFEYAYFHTPGRSIVTLPAGDATVEVTRGPEYRPARRRVRVASDSTTVVRIELARLADLAARGWYSGDLHVHMNYGGHYRADPKTLRRQAEAEDLHVVANLIVNKEGRVPDIGWFTRRADAASTPATLILHDQEFHTSVWGHVGLLGLRALLLPGYAAYARTAAASLYPTNAATIAAARAEGAIAGYVHPFDAYPDPADRSTPLTSELPADVALGLVDYMEIVGFSDHLSTARVWYRLLNCGFRIPAGAGTDAMTNFASLRGPVGMNRVYVRTGPRLDRVGFLGGLKAGRTFATNGPLVELTLGGRGPGDEIRLDGGPAKLRLRAGLTSYVPVDRFELVGNGEVLASFRLSAGGASARVDTTITVERSGWYTVRAGSEHATHPVLDRYPFATTSPVYVTVAGEGLRSPADAAYFVAWIDRLAALAEASADWNDAAERDEVLEMLRRARVVYARQLTP